MTMASRHHAETHGFPVFGFPSAASGFLGAPGGGPKAEAAREGQADFSPEGVAGQLFPPRLLLRRQHVQHLVPGLRPQVCGLLPVLRARPSWSGAEPRSPACLVLDGSNSLLLFPGEPERLEQFGIAEGAGTSFLPGNLLEPAGL